MLKEAALDFFATFFNADFDVSILDAFCICFTLMLVYGILIRPWINICGGTK